MSIHPIVTWRNGFHTPLGDLLPGQPDMTELGARIRQLREEQGLGREALASRAGISARGLEELEKAEAPNPQLATLVGIARGLGVTLDELVGWKDEIAERLRLIRLLADPGETPDDVTVALHRYLRRMMAGLDDTDPQP